MQTQTGTGTRSRQVRPPSVAYPRDLDPNGMFFWLGELLCCQAEVEALNTHAIKHKLFDDTPLSNGIYHAMGLYDKEICILADRVKKDGTLPYAHHHTTVFEGGAA